MVMNTLLELLQGGDIRSDGLADEVASDVLLNNELFPFLLEGLDEEDDLIRGRTSHALEKVSRKQPELFQENLEQLILLAQTDKLPMVRWHLAMLFANLDLSTSQTDQVIYTLYYLLKDESIFVKTWSISSLTILALDNPSLKEEIIMKIKILEEDNSLAVKNRVFKALEVLEGGKDLPKGWSKKNKSP